MSATHGQWMGVQNTVATSDGRRLFILHAILMRTGKVLVWSGHTEGMHYAGEAYEWDPVSDPTMSTAGLRDFPPGVDIFCCHQTNLEDGRVMSVGGSHEHDHGHGIRDICIYDPDAAAPSWQKIGEMSVGRWYPTLVTLADGSVLAFSGRDDSGSHLAASVEHFRLPIEGPGYTPQVLAGGDKHLASYPGLHLVRGGRTVLTGTTWRYEMEQNAPINTFTFRKTGATTGSWTDEGIAPGVNNREEGMSILLPPAQDGKILLVGGGWWSDHQSSTAGHRSGTNLRSAAILDTATMQWRSLADMHHPRMNVNVVLLPDQKVLVHGGQDTYKWDGGQAPSNVAELYDPVLDTWTEVAAMSERRTYHSASLLLPDGSVLAMGGVDPSSNEPGTSSTLNQKTYEFYRPPYFFKGTRPTIAAVTSDHAPADRLPYGTTVTVAGTSDTPVLRVALIRLGAMTHHTDSEQRYVALDFVVTSYDSTTKAFSLRAGVPGDANVAPPGWYMLWVVDDQERPCDRARMVHLSRRQCSIVTDRSHFARDEVSASAASDFANSFYVIMDGFRPAELGITTASPTDAQIASWAPSITFAKAIGGASVGSMSATPNQIGLEAGLDVPQRVAFRYTLHFANDSAFLDSGGVEIEDQQVLINSSKDGYTCSAPVRLTTQPRPFMLDGDPAWLSIDVRVFSLRQNQSRFGQNVGDSASQSLSFLNTVLNDLNLDPANGQVQFDAIDTGQSSNPVFLSTLAPGTSERVYNFAIAKVRYRGQTLPADDVGVFFRIFRAQATGVEFRRNSTYRTIVNDFGERVPVLGIEGGQAVTVPFFAEARVNTAVQSLARQRDQANRRNLTAVGSGGAERVAFFGCWLDINQTAARFPLGTGNPTGPYSAGMQSIQTLLRSSHCCLVAEIDFGTDWLQDGDTPGGNDSLSQRNLAVVGSDNPGSPATHTVLHTFEIRPSPAMAVGTSLADFREFEVVTNATFAAVANFPPRLIERRADELMIEWSNLPAGSSATVYMPGIAADEVIELHGRRAGPENVERIDQHTLRLTVGAQRIVYIPLPPSRQETIAALFSIELPDTVRKRELYRLTVRQIDGMARKILGSCEWAIPVTSADQLLPEEQSRLAVFQHIAQTIPADDQWAPIFGRYIDHQRDKVRGLGGDPEIVGPSPDGHDPRGGAEEPGEDGGGALGTRQGFCCRLYHLIAIFAVLLALSLLLPLPAAVRLAAALFTGGAIIAGLLVGMRYCLCGGDRRTIVSAVGAREKHRRPDG